MRKNMVSERGGGADKKKKKKTELCQTVHRLLGHRQRWVPRLYLLRPGFGSQRRRSPVQGSFFFFLDLRLASFGKCNVTSLRLST